MMLQQQLYYHSFLTTTTTTAIIIILLTIITLPPNNARAHALTTPPTTNNNPNPHNPPTLPSNTTTPPQQQNWDVTCVPKRGLFTPCPSYHDCLRAIFQLPDLHGDGAFHNGAPDDVFRLPVRKSHGSCGVRVELAHEGGGRQSASWKAVIARAVVVDSLCIDTPMWETQNSGGWTAMGSQQRLLIILEYDGDEIGGDDVTVL